MSMINTAAAYRRKDSSTIRVPVVMPLVDVNVDADGSLTLTLDRKPYSADGTLTRDDLSRILNDIATDLGTAIRVEVHEVDASTFTDILTPQPPDVRVLRPTSEAPTSIGVVAGGGFTPHEDVAVAVVVAHQVANADGATRLRLPPALLEAHPGQVVLMGRSSGTVQFMGGAG